MKTLKLESKKFLLMTLHRQENTDELPRLMEILNSVFDTAKKHNLQVVFPIHPRTLARLKNADLSFPQQVIITEPIGYDDFLVLEKNARLIASDSGGLQEEGCILGVPCVTLRENTERPETIRIGSNVLAGVQYAKIQKAIQKMLKVKKTWKSPYGGGKAAQKIVQIMLGHKKK